MDRVAERERDLGDRRLWRMSGPTAHEVCGMDRPTRRGEVDHQGEGVHHHQRLEHRERSRGSRELIEWNGTSETKDRERSIGGDPSPGESFGERPGRRPREVRGVNHPEHRPGRRPAPWGRTLLYKRLARRDETRRARELTVIEGSPTVFVRSGSQDQNAAMVTTLRPRSDGRPGRRREGTRHPRPTPSTGAPPRQR